MLIPFFTGLAIVVGFLFICFIVGFIKDLITDEGQDFIEILIEGFFILILLGIIFLLFSFVGILVLGG